jgi:hypothetical protein
MNFEAQNVLAIAINVVSFIEDNHGILQIDLQSLSKLWIKDVLIRHNYNV